MANILTEFGSVESQPLLAGTEVSALTTSVTLLADQGVLKKGSLLGKVTASGKYKLVSSASNDGSQVASYVLAEDVDTTGADTNAVAYKTGLFRAESLIVASGDTVDAHADELRDVNIYFKTDRG